MLFKRKPVKQKVPKRLAFDAVVKKMDVRGGPDGCFIWLKERGTDREFTGNFFVDDVRIDVPRSFLEETVYYMEGRKKREVPLEEVLGGIGDTTREFKFVRLSRPLRFRVKPTGEGSISIVISVPE